MKNSTCCFTGHRALPKTQQTEIEENLNHAINHCIAQGVTTFLCGGALGFDQMAAQCVLEKKKTHENISLIFTLPCQNQDAHWRADQKAHYQSLLHQADEICYVSETYDDACMKKRNYYMVDHSAYCIHACLRKRSGTGQTVAYACKKGVILYSVVKCNGSGPYENM